MWTSGQSLIFDSNVPEPTISLPAVLPKAPDASASIPVVCDVARCNTIVHLSDEEVKFCEAYGMLRQNQNERGGTYDMKYTTGRSGVELHVQGVRGELALAKLLGRDVYTDVCADICQAHCRNNVNDVKKDVEWQGLKIDVKCSRARAPYGLLVTANKRRAPADAYALMVDHGGTRLAFLGASTGTEVFKTSRKTKKWGKNYYAVPLAELGDLSGGEVLAAKVEGCFFNFDGDKAAWAGK